MKTLDQRMKELAAEKPQQKAVIVFEVSTSDGVVSEVKVRTEAADSFEREWMRSPGTSTVLRKLIEKYKNV